ncbi:hypothetical protein EJV47_21910 [Hymenobacter gummosus]|uniref:Uncharacterized protein n=1 Tax=Hymenobacter gummosus TaxID=1776032 RepID=A0A3S0K2H3_9BACT|nr:hypothetical protein [Hymenobacter gummosus]RTQ46604.1 hypothetical protein EJV47_21910 [Hymenobacter gummosus]
MDLGTAVSGAIGVCKGVSSAYRTVVTPPKRRLIKTKPRLQEQPGLQEVGARTPFLPAKMKKGRAKKKSWLRGFFRKTEKLWLQFFGAAMRVGLEYLIKQLL